MSDDDTETYLVQMVPHAPEAPTATEPETATQSVTDTVIQRHTIKLLSDATAAIDSLKGKTVTIDWPRLPGETQDARLARFEEFKRGARAGRRDAIRDEHGNFLRWGTA